MMFFGCCLMAGIVIIMGVQVFFRYVLNDSIIWAEEMSRYLLIWITFLFLGIAYQRGELISLNLFLQKVPRIVQLVLTILAFLAILGTLGVLTWYGFKFAEVNSIQTLPAFDFIWSAITGTDEELNFSSYWLYASVPVGAILLAIHLFLGVIVRVRRILAGEAVYTAQLRHEPVGEGTRSWASSSAISSPSW